MTRILLAGGCDKDERKLAPKLAARGIEVGWHWQTDSALSKRSKLPPACEGILIFTQACSHSLSGGVGALARLAQVPVIPFDSWPRLWTALTSVGLLAHTPIAERITISVKDPVMAEPSAHTTTLPGTSHWASHFPSDEEVVQTAKTQWEALPLKNRQNISSYFCSFDRDPTRTFSMPFSVRGDLFTFESKPRAYAAFVLLASKDFMVTAATIGFTYYTLFGKKLDHHTTTQITAAVQAACGDGYGLRKGTPGGEKKGTPPTDVAPPFPLIDLREQPEVLPPVPVPSPEVSLTPSNPIRNLPHKPSDEDVFLSAHSDWDKTAKGTQEAVLSFLSALDGDSKAEMPPEVRAFLLPYNGQPRAFVVLCILATKGAQILSATVEHAYDILTNKHLRTESLPKMMARVQEFYGEADYSYRRVVPGTSTRFIRDHKPAEPISPEAPPEESTMVISSTRPVVAPVTIPVLLAAPKVTPVPKAVEVAPTPKVLSLQDRCIQHVLKSVEAGRKVTTYKENDQYVVVHADYEIVFRAKTS